MIEPVDILAFGAHPDDVELSAAGTMIKHKALGMRTAIVDLTRGELGSRGSADLRDKESAESAKIMRLDYRHNLNLGDGFFEINEDTLISVIEQIRLLRPKMILCNAESDRHPDHQRGGELIERAAFLSGLIKIETFYGGLNQVPWRPVKILHYIQDYWIDPEVIVDVSGFEEEKMKAIMSYSSQFYNPECKEPETPISSKAFMDHVKGRMQSTGRLINVAFAEGFTCNTGIGIDNLLKIK